MVKHVSTKSLSRRDKVYSLKTPPLPIYHTHPRSQKWSITLLPFLDLDPDPDPGLGLDLDLGLDPDPDLLRSLNRHLRDRVA
jgi:hypothetical protein